MKISVNKVLYHWYSKVYNNWKSLSVQLSWIWNPYWIFEFYIHIGNGFGDKANISIRILGLIELVLYKTDLETDHAGYSFQLHIFGLDFEVEYRDVRHWDYDNDKWEEGWTIEQMNENYKKR